MNVPKQATPIIRNTLAHFSRSRQVSGMSITGILPSQCACKPTGDGGCTITQNKNNCQRGRQRPQCTSVATSACTCECVPISTPLIKRILKPFIGG
jgi:hypothetical protein